MKSNNMTKKICALSAALAIVMTMGVSAFAEEAAPAEAPETAVVEQVVTEATPALDSEAIAAAQEAALAAYDAAVDAVLDEMAAAGALTQDVVDSYRAQRNAQREVSKFDTSNFTLDQLSALRQGVRGKGNINETILAGLVSQGAMTQEQADMFKLAYSESVNIWGQIDSSKATQGMMTKLQEARAAYQQALVDAGVIGARVKGGMVSGTKGSTNSSNRSGVSGTNRSRSIR